MVGDGTHEANYCISGAGGLHNFANVLVITNNALLNGTGNVEGTLTVTPGGVISPGENSIGTVTLFGKPVLQRQYLHENRQEQWLNQDPAMKSRLGSQST